MLELSKVISIDRILRKYIFSEFPYFWKALGKPHLKIYFQQIISDLTLGQRL